MNNYCSNLNQLCTFTGIERDAAFPSELPLILRSTIARQVEVETFKRTEAVMPRKKCVVPVYSTSSNVQSLPTHYEEDEDTMRKRNPFAFAYDKVQLELSRAKQAAVSPSDIITIRYKFKRGYTNGIKRSLKCIDFK